MNSINNKKPSFVLPKLQKNQKTDLISILSLQPKTVSELDQFRLSDFHTNCNNNNNNNNNNNVITNNNNDFQKNYMNGLLELMRNQLVEFGNVVIEMRKCMQDKKSDDDTSESLIKSNENKFQSIFERMDKFEKSLNNMVINQENFFEKFEKKFVELASEIENRTVENRNILETSTDQFIEILTKKVTTKQQNIVLYDTSNKESKNFVRKIDLKVENQQKRKYNEIEHKPKYKNKFNNNNEDKKSKRNNYNIKRKKNNKKFKQNDNRFLFNSNKKTCSEDDGDNNKSYSIDDDNDDENNEELLFIFQ